MTNFDFSVPVVVVGGGACGCIAALAAREAGAEVLLIEQDAHPAGSTGMSQGLVCAAGTKAQAAHHIEDSADRLFEDIMIKTRGQADSVIARAIAEASGPCLDWMSDQQRLPWELDSGFRAAYGHSVGRVHGWRGHGGIDMVQLLHQRLAEAEIDIALEARLTDIMSDGSGRVVGIEIERPGGERDRIGTDALILASGGFAANRDMVEQAMPEAAVARFHGHEGSRGDAIILGQKIGAAVGDMGSYQGYAMLTDPQGISVPPGVIIEGGILINRRGERFTDETADISGMVHPLLAQPGGEGWVIFDSKIEQRCDYIPETIALIELNAARKDDTIDGLARRIGVDEAALEAAITEAREAQAVGRPDRLGRVWKFDFPPSAPFLALKVIGGLYHTQGGLQIDGDARVVRADGSSFANLFAGGGAARGVSGPSSWGYLPAMGLCAAVTLGRIAGIKAARQALAESA